MIFTKQVKLQAVPLTRSKIHVFLFNLRHVSRYVEYYKVYYSETGFINIPAYFFADSFLVRAMFESPTMIESSIFLTTGMK